jgi:hypothetical protein
MDQVGQTPSRVGLGASQPAQLHGQPASLLGGFVRALVATRLHEEEKPGSVERVGGGPINSYKYPPSAESRNTTLIL